MDAAAYLKSRGWRGKGHALHADKGLATPLLISRNTDGRGVGHTANDQWWLQAFDQKLKGLDVSKKGVVTQTVTAGKLDSVSTAKGKYSGLYAAFVSGGLMAGTITPDTGDEATDGTPASEDREHVPGLKHGVKIETKEERRARKEARRVRKIERAVRRAARAERRSASAAKPKSIRKPTKKEAKPVVEVGETKEQRKARRAERRARKEMRRKRRE
ncbi:hypothetical protein GQ53DRAFT_605875, partial [Thozetella sp. PMI_491]